LHSFTGSDGQNPVAGVTLAYDGNYYGTTSGGGNANSGVLFKIAPTGEYTILYQFTGGSDGSFPAAPPILASDGNLYGTNEGGTNNNGTIYKYSPTLGTFTTIFTLNSDGSQGSFIEAPLVQGPDGSLYGTAPAGGVNGCGYELQGCVRHVHDGSNSDGGHDGAGGGHDIHGNPDQQSQSPHCAIDSKCA
jgi:uncharacterized repeat protein (TIGR03803 family)